ncbi:MFS family permease [Paraburkholderia bryophila]|uniref:MFS family permease n=1 Tax=Paraburkholderia bryophila TaxID=420952 RepID=A0A7Z0B030_9BURK|nr:MFS family permease [Paraburkholderia bryophila]
MRRVILRLVPFLMASYFMALLDRVNIGFAALQMNADLGLSHSMFGFAASLYFVAYFIAEVPSNLALEKFGARRWIARIMITWGLIASLMAFVVGPNSLYVMRFLLGLAEAGFFPGTILYLSYWLPKRYRAQVLGIVATSNALASFASGPLSVALLKLHGAGGLRGWQWLFLLEGIPAVLLGIAALFVLVDSPKNARFLTLEQREWLRARLASERSQGSAVGHLSLWALLRNPYFLVMALLCSVASATSSVLAVWQPQFLKSFGLTNTETGFINSIPYAITIVAMILWARHSDRTGERRLHTAVPLLLTASGFAVISFGSVSLPIVLVCLTCCLVGAYSFKGPFWAMSSQILSPQTMAAGVAGINAISNLIGGGLMVNVVAQIKQHTGSYSTAMSPLVVLGRDRCIGFDDCHAEKQGTHWRRGKFFCTARVTPAFYPMH